MTIRRDDPATDPRPQSRLDADTREQLIARTVSLALDAGEPAAAVHELEARLRAGSDAYTKTRADGMITVFEDRIADREAARAARIRRDHEQVTAADREQARRDLEAMYTTSRWATPHAKRLDGSDEHVAAVEMRARELARRRIAAEDADARLRAMPPKPRADAKEECDPFAPSLPADPAWKKRGR